jgi:5-formaminoimidazole-4-carboxamide-1-beta-D-ribofuranosyl 5'-monophosphate synthetase
MRAGKQTRPTSITPPKPIIINIFCLSNIRTTGENKLVFDFIFRVEGPQSMDDEAYTAIRWETTERWDILDWT